MKVSLVRAFRALAVTSTLAACVNLIGLSERGVTVVGAAEPGRLETLTPASSRADEEIARLRAKLFERVDYPLLMRRLDSDIELAKAEIQMHQKVLFELERLHRMAHESKPFLVTIEELKLKRLAAELRLDDLEAERCLLQKYQRDERRLRELEARRDVLRTQR